MPMKQVEQATRFKGKLYKTGNQAVDAADQWINDHKVPFGEEASDDMKRQIQEHKHIVYDYYDHLSVGELLEIVCNGRVSQYVYQLAVYKIKQKTGAELFKIKLADVQ